MSKDIQSINTEEIKWESQEQLKIIKQLIQEIKCIIDAAINSTIRRSRILNPVHLVFQNWLFSQQYEIKPSKWIWDMIFKHFYNAINIEKWMLVSFSTSCSCNKNALKKFVKKLRQEGEDMVMKLASPLLIRHSNESHRSVEDFIKEAKETEPNLQLAVVVLPTEGFHEIYTKIKTVAETEVGLMAKFIKDRDVLKKLLDLQLIFQNCQKINAKMGGINTSLLSGEIPLAFRKNT